MTITIRRCTSDDVLTLQQVAYETFDDAFRDLNTPEAMEAYLTKAFALPKLAGELANPCSTFFFIEKDGEIAGYMKVNMDDAQSDRVIDDALEIERIYVRSKFQGQRLGEQLIRRGLELAREQQKKHVWLGVWELNPGAIRFYERMGFAKHSSHSFFMGDEEQTDYIMILNL